MSEGCSPTRRHAGIDTEIRVRCIVVYVRGRLETASSHVHNRQSGVPMRFASLAVYLTIISPTTQHRTSSRRCLKEARV